MQSTVFDQWGRSYTLPGLYEEFDHTFRLVYTGDDGEESAVVIREPAKWDGLKMNLKRDEDTHGVHYEFSDDNTELEFDAYSGRDLIEAIYAAKGPDALIRIQYGIVNGDDYIIEYEGKLNLSTRKAAKRKTACGIERKSLASVVKSRWETAVDLYSNTSLDDEVLDPYYGQYLPLSPQAIVEGFEHGLGSQKAEQTFVGDTNGHIWIQFDTSKPTLSEIDEFAAGKPIGVSEMEGPIANDEWLFKFRSSGIRTINLEVSYRFWCSVKKRSIGLVKAKMRGYSLETVLVHKKADGTVTEYPVTTRQVEGIYRLPPSGWSEAEVGVSASGSIKGLTIDTAAGDKLFLYGLFRFGHNLNELGTTQVTLQVSNFRLTVTGQSNNKATQALFMPVLDALQSAFQLVTSQGDCVRSPYYGRQGDRYDVTGCGALKAILNGYHIRGYTLGADNRPRALTVSPRDLVTSLQAIDAVGMSFLPEVDDLTGEVRDVVYIDDARSFYRDVELLRLDSVSEFRAEVIPQRIFSKIETGYEKWVDEGKGALEECFTSHQIATPMRSEYATAAYKSKLVASSLAIELTRREQFADTPKDSTTWDESVFMIQCKEHSPYIGAFTTLRITRSIVQVPMVIDWITPGTLIRFSGGPYNGTQVYTVTGIAETTAAPWVFFVREVLSPAVITAGQIIPHQSLAWLPETGADMDQVAGLSAGRSAYNLRHTPGRILRRQMPHWAGCLKGKPVTQSVRPAKQPQNSAVSVRLGSGIAGCDEPGLVADAEPIRVDEAAQHTLVRPERFLCSARMSWQQLQRLRLAHTGLLPMEEDDDGNPVDRNYGYIVLPDDDGNPVAGYLMNLTWSPADEKVTLELIRKGIDLDDTSTGSCTQWAAFSLADAESAVDTDRNLLELCRYGDFDSL